MYLLLIIIVFFALVGALLNWKGDKFDMIFNTVIVTVFGSLFASMLLLPGARVLTTEEVPVEFPIYSVGGQYTTHGTMGEYNNPIITYYWKDEFGAMRQGSQYSGSVALRETHGDPRAYMTCPDDSTAWSWTLFPWEDPEPNCDNEFITLYVPEGEA